MQFEGGQLAAILDGQSDRVALFDSSGAYREDVEPGVALKIATAGPFVGIGHGKRIRYIRPAGASVQWHGPIRRDIAAVMVDFPRLPHATPKEPGAHSFVPEPRFAHTGHAGKVSTVHFG